MLNKHITTDNLKTILPPIQHAIDKLDKKVGKPDWNENDPNASGYIKNRPFYEEFTLVTIIQNTTFEGNSLNHYSYFLPLFYFMEDPSVFQETTFIVNFDGIDYEHKGKVVASDQGYIGNGRLSYDALPYTGEPFCIFIYGPYAWINTNSTANMHTFSVKAFVPEVVKIDEKYLPELVGKKGTGENAEVFNGGSADKASGYYSHAEGDWSTASGYVSHAEGTSTIASGNYSHAEGNSTEASGENSHAECASTIASGDESHAEGDGSRAEGNASHAEGNTTYATGDFSHAEGSGAKASGEASHAEGQGTTASGEASHAEGSSTTAEQRWAHAEGHDSTASGECAHAEGFGTTASAQGAHAEGGSTIASGNYSHAEGMGTIAASDYQHAQGAHNIEDSAGKYLHIVGNSKNSNSRSNAHTLDWNGNAWFQGTIKIGGTGQDDANAVEVATKADLSAAKSAILLTDQVNGYNYVISMQNGSITSRCATKYITVTSMPTKTTYYSGDYLDPTGMTVVATAYDGATRDITDSVDLTGYLSEGDTAVEIVYVDAGITHATTIPVTVNAFDPVTVLVDFTYTSNNDGTYTITGWKQTLNGSTSTEMIIPNNAFIVV